jgi:hypothetical protein
MTSSDPIKDAFARIKQDIFSLQEQISYLSQQIEELKRTLVPQNPTQNPSNQSIQQIIPAIQHTQDPTLPLEGLKPSNSDISTGNGGVPTDSQSDSQTVQQTEKPIDFTKFHSEESAEIHQNSSKTDQISQVQRVSEVLETLDSIKKEIRSNFKHLTSQEMAVFTAVYTLEEQGFVVDYPLISQKLGLSESSIRDYTHKLIRKSIPIVKSKENNKKITLSISPELKKIASLQTILALRKL